MRKSPPRRALLRAQVLRATSARSPIPPHIYRSISLHLDDSFAAGKYLKDGPLKEGEGPPAAPNILSDPSAMDGMMAGMKTQMVMMVPQMVIMGWINFFFQGFVLSECFRCLNYIPTHTKPLLIFLRNAVQKVGRRVFLLLISEPRTRFTNRICSEQSNSHSPSLWDSSRCCNEGSRPPTWMCDGYHLSRGISSTFSVSTDCTGSYSGAITVCSVPTHLFFT